MSQTERYERLRLLVRQRSRQRRRQARQIDVLCNDLVGAQRTFLHRLQDIGFAAEFYRALLGSTDVRVLLARAGQTIAQEFPGVAVAFFLRQPDGGEFYAAPGGESLHDGRRRPQDCFDPELAEAICKRNQPCTLDDLSRVGADSDWETLNRYSLMTLPLSDQGRSLGFVLLYCRLPQVLHATDIRRVRPVLCGLAQAVRAVHVPLTARQ